MEIIQWQPFEHIMAGTTLRNGGVSTGSLSSLNLALNVQDDIENVIANRKILAQYLKTDLSHMVSPTQTHSTHLKKVTKEDCGRGMVSLDDAFFDTDALYTREKNLYLLTYHADCIPVLLYDCKEELIAAIHSGWKGNVSEITLKTLNYLALHENVKPQNIYAYIGPSLSFEAFEARDDIIDLVKQMSIDTEPYYVETAPGIYHLDAKGLVKAQLCHFGVPLNQITIDPHCTKSSPELFFSYRRDHACGRHASFIAMIDK